MIRHAKLYPTQEAALSSKKGRSGTHEAQRCTLPSCDGGWHLEDTTARQESARKQRERESRPRKDTGFSRLVKEAVRQRAANRCEACGVAVPPGCEPTGYAGPAPSAGGMGGSADPVTNSIANAALMCGTPASGCHGLAEKRDRHMGAMGFWLGQHEDPRLVPIMLHGEYGGAMVWLTGDGWYSTEAPAQRREAS